MSGAILGDGGLSEEVSGEVLVTAKTHDENALSHHSKMNRLKPSIKQTA